MSGAVVPDDWDGSTFKCYRVEWPQSEQYEALLLGATTRPSFLNYWDPSTGDAEQAAEAITNAYNLTLPDFYTVECECPVPTKGFKVKKTSEQALTAGLWSKVTWQAFEYDENSPQFSLANDAHQITDTDLLGLWHYDVLIGLVGATAMWIASTNFQTSVDIASTHDNTQFITFSFDYLWEAVGPMIGIRVNSPVATNIIQNVVYSQFSGHYVGPVA